MKLLKLILFTTFPFLLVSQFALADSVFLQKIKGKGVSQGQSEAVEELTRSAIEDLGGYKLVSSKGSAEIQLRARLIKLGESIIFSMSKYEDGKKTDSTKLKALDFDDIDRVVVRVVRAVLKGKNAKKNAQLDDVTREEVTSTNRRIEPVSQWRFGIGPVAFSNLNESDAGVGFFLGRHFAVNPDFAVNLNLDLAYGREDSNASIVSGQVGIDYFFTRSNTSIYITGNTGYSTAALNDKDVDDSVINIFGESKSGFSVNAGVGVKLFRVSTINIAFQVDYNYLFSENSLGNPNWTTLKILLFKGGN